MCGRMRTVGNNEDNNAWALRLETSGDGPRLAVKDCIDVAGTPTVVGCRAFQDAQPARLDAPVVATARRQGARVVGKTNLVELCRHADGVNEWTGTPVNPLDPERIPGGSSSGSAVAVAGGEADVAYGTDTGGSVRVPAACCGVAGLKTTSGRIPTHGVFEFSRTLDTVGPLAPDVAGLELGMRLMEPGFAAVPGGDHSLTAARVRVPKVDPMIDAAVDAVLDAAGVRADDVELPDWADWIRAANDLMAAEGYWAHRHLLDRADLLEPRHVADLEEDAHIPASRVVECRRIALAQQRRLADLLAGHDLIALPTLRMTTPRLGEHAPTTYLTVPFNLAGLPALALPVPRPDHAMPASVQLVGEWYGEERLLGYGARVEAAVAERSELERHQRDR